jgi:hypothetical protein
VTVRVAPRAAVLSYVVAQHPENEALREKWMKARAYRILAVAAICVAAFSSSIS